VKGLITRTVLGQGSRIELGLTETGQAVLDCPAPAVDAVTMDMLSSFRSAHGSFVDGASRHMLALNPGLRGGSDLAGEWIRASTEEVPGRDA
jgi:hypothetical protein